MTIRLRFNHWLPKLLKVDGITLYPYILIAISEHEAVIDTYLLQHECIHLSQIRKMGVFKFYFTYLLDTIKYAYRERPAESEAYIMQAIYPIPDEVRLQLSRKTLWLLEND